MDTARNTARSTALTPALSPRRIRWEIIIVLALSLGASAVYSVVSIINKLTQDTALSEQASKLNQSLAERPLFDLTYQLLAIVFALAPVALVIFLTWRDERPHLGNLGLTPGSNRSWWLRDSASGLLLAATVGIPGIALYLAARQLGLNTRVEASGLDAFWWTIPVLILAALKAALVEEIIVVGYLFNRLRMLGWGTWAIILTSSLLRASYHLYQGFGGFIGNFAMGILFGWVYQRWGRLLPLIIAHWMLDIASFVGYAWAVSTWPQLF
jgi:membrane protease YdiL (CAAX protease family)